MARHVTSTSSASSPAYTAVNTAIWVIYLALVVLVTMVLRFHAPIAVAGCVLIVAAFLYPVRRRAGRAAKRRFG
jgi:hypothetical protein